MDGEHLAKYFVQFPGLVDIIQQMRELTDHELLTEFARAQSEEAFATLVTQYVNLVYSTARRFTGNAHHAEEITQAVFVILARKAGAFSARVVLSGWLYQTTRLTAANFMKAEIRRQRREQEAYMQSTLNDAGSSETWQRIAPLLEDAMGRLGETDRNAVVLRFFENKTAAEAASILNLTEAATHKRTNRALDKLRKIFSKQGVSSTTSIIAGLISAHSIHTAPATVVNSVKLVAAAKGALVGASTLTVIQGVLKVMAWTKAKTAVGISIGVLVTVGTAVLLVQEISRRPDMSDLQGTWRGEELGAGRVPGPVQITLHGTTIDFRGADPREWYKATVSLRENTKPKQLSYVVTECSEPDYVGKTGYGIYAFENAGFKLSANEPGVQSVPASFNAPGVRQFLFKKGTAGATLVADTSTGDGARDPAALAEIKTGQSIPGWGDVINPDGDCTVAFTDGKLAVNLPGTDHALMPERGRTNAPRVMREVAGTFDVQVKVAAHFTRDAKTIVPKRNAYQDAGLLLWLDDKNNLKLAPAQIVVDGKTYRYLNLEFRHEGQKGELPLPRESGRVLQSPTIYLRLQIHKDQTTASVSADGVKWISTSLPGDGRPEKMQVGLIAENNTTSPLSVGFEEFVVKSE
jgi:RNA polymerase sigma factor (sigma-70 family)